MQYEIYEPINKTKLDLSVCKDIPININVPVILSENLQGLHDKLKDLGYDIFDINNEFYQDICTPYMIKYKILDHQMVLMFYYLIGLIVFLKMMKHNASLIAIFQNILLKHKT